MPLPASTGPDRLAGLTDAGRRLLAEATAALQRRDAAALARGTTALRALAPRHPEVLRLTAAVAQLQGRAGEAVGMRLDGGDGVGCGEIGDDVGAHDAQYPA